MKKQTTSDAKRRAANDVEKDDDPVLDLSYGKILPPITVVVRTLPWVSRTVTF